MTKPLVTFETNLSSEQAAQLADLEAFDKQEDALHAKHNTRREGERKAVVFLKALEVAAEVKAINARIAELSSIIDPATIAARGYDKLRSEVLAQVGRVKVIAQEALRAGLLRLAKGETVDLLALVMEAHPAGLAVLSIDAADEKRLFEALFWPASRANPEAIKNTDFDVTQRLAEEISERERLLERRRVIAPTPSEIEHQKWLDRNRT